MTSNSGAGDKGGGPAAGIIERVLGAVLRPVYVVKGWFKGKGK